MSEVEVKERVERISLNELNEMLDRPEVVILDVRDREDWDASEEMIEGAVAEDPQHPEKWLKRYPREHTFVLYCA